VTVARLAREILPGDSRFGDPLSTAGDGGAEVVGRRVSQLTAKRPGAVREAGLAAAQVWQSLSEAQGRGRGHDRVTIVFTASPAGRSTPVTRWCSSCCAT